MNNDVITEYVKYVNSSLMRFFKILMGNNYNFSIVRTFVNKYIDVRYYNDTLYKREKDFVTKISKELNLVAKDMISEYPNEEENIKNISALFGYVIYFDECIPYDSVNKLINTLFNDSIIKLNYTPELKSEFSSFIKEFNEKKSKYFKLFDTKEFELKFKRMKYHVYNVDVVQHCNISKLYSEYAIDKAFDSGVLAEQKIYLMYVMLSYKILCDLVVMDYSSKYIVPFPVSILNKTKKSVRYYNALNNDYLKSHISLTFTYSDYLANKDVIKNILKEGYSVAVILDESFKMNLESLILFSYCIVFKDSIYYDSLMDMKDEIKAEIIAI